MHLKHSYDEKTLYISGYYNHNLYHHQEPTPIGIKLISQKELEQKLTNAIKDGTATVSKK